VIINWDGFRQPINKRLTLNVFLKTEEDIEAAVKFLMKQYNGQVGMQRQNIQTHSIHVTALH
jgi:hypothetical protein